MPALKSNQQRGSPNTENLGTVKTLFTGTAKRPPIGLESIAQLGFTDYTNSVRIFIQVYTIAHVRCLLRMLESW